VTRALYLHIGAPKSGTTFIQDRLERNYRSLTRHGVHLPAQLPLVEPVLFQFRASLDLMGQDWGGRPGHSDGAWEALVRKVRRAKGPTVVSHEVLSTARPEHVARLKRDLDGIELHIVYTARDLARQVPAAWQESVKQGRGWTYAGFVRRVQRGKAWFSRAFDLPEVLTTWGVGLPTDHIHVVTVPRRGLATEQPDLLWHRFCEAVPVDPAWAPRPSERRNPSLGAAETQMLRRLNRRLGPQTRREQTFDHLIRRGLAESELVGLESPVVRLPPDAYDWAEERAQHWLEWIEQSGVHVVGDLAELRPLRPPADFVWIDPDRVSTKKQLDAAIVALAAMTREAARRPDPDLALSKKVRTGVRRIRGEV
jgi:hypothetical protein